MYAGISVNSPSGIFGVEIMIDHVPQPTYTDLDGHRWVAGAPGQVCKIMVHSFRGRIGVALAVDGRDANADRPADLSNPALQIISTRYVFEGFRVDNSTARAFEFGNVSGSVAG